MITFDDVSFAYQGGISDGSEPPALRHIHFHAERGECIVLCGKSGCGKTTMLRMVNGLVPHFYQGRLEGDITVGNVHIKEASLPPGCRRGGQRVSESEDTVFSSGYDRRDGVQYGKFEHPA